MNGRATSYLILSVLLLHVIGLVIFCKGFLLARVVISQYSGCDNRSTAGSDEEDLLHTCNAYPRKFRRVVWILVDALRYDFTDYDKEIGPHTPHYKNKMPLLNQLLQEQPRHARRFKFVADPPTTTMQRLKALTTGSLPTFVDISSNFNSYEILEDNLIYQCRQNGMRTTFLGDDTWLGLYPGLLDKTYPYPSLNVQDLDTVDDGVILHIGKEIKSKAANFLIGHFLGVDHCGHTYGPTHVLMSRKLTQMDGVIVNEIVPLIDNDTILFVFGDHGMTSTGDHGGETEMETSAVLVVYSARPLFNPDQGASRSVYQTDIVPTVSLLLGLPIPFSNLGMIIPELFLTAGSMEVELPASKIQSSLKDVNVSLDFLSALKSNADQLARYLYTYVQHTRDFPDKFYQELDLLFNHTRDLHEGLLVKIEKEDAVVTKTADREINMLIRERQEELVSIAEAYMTYLSRVKEICQGIWAEFEDSSIVLGIVLLSFPVLILCCVLLCHIAFHSPTSFLSGPGWGIDCISSIVLSLSSLSVFSNSFIVFEQDAVLFLQQSLLVCFLFSRLRRIFTAKAERMLPSSQLLTMVYHCSWHVLGVMVCVRVVRMFHICRDQQDTCVEPWYVRPVLSLLPTVHYPDAIRFLCTYALVALLMYRMWIWMKNSLSLNQTIVAIAVLALPASCLCLFLTWTRVTSFFFPCGVVAFPRVVYGFSMVLILAAIVRPFQFGSDICPDVRNRLKLFVSRLWIDPLCVITMATWTALTMLLNDAMALSSCFFLMQSWLSVKMFQTFSEVPVFSRAVFWLLVSYQFFFGFGHQATVTSLRFEAAFVGIQGELTPLTLPLAALLVGLNTLASQILSLLVLPLVVPNLELFKESQMSHLFLAYVGAGSLKLLCAVIAATVHRRHLMIWAVFGPRFLYEAAFQCLCDCGALLVLRLVIRFKNLAWCEKDSDRTD